MKSRFIWSIMSSLPAKFPFSIENILSGSSYKNNSFENGATPRTNVKGPQLTTTEPSFMEILNSKNLSIDYQQNVFGNGELILCFFVIQIQFKNINLTLQFHRTYGLFMLTVWTNGWPRMHRWNEKVDKFVSCHIKLKCSNNDFHITNICR